MRSEPGNSRNDDSLGLIDRVIQFSRRLRRGGVPVSFASVLDVARGLRFIDIFDVNAFRSLLRMNLIFRKQDIGLFNDLFDAFWLTGELESTASRSDAEETSGEGGKEKGSPADRAVDLGDPDRQDEASTERVQDWVASYSPDAVKRKRRPVDFLASDEIYQLIKKWLSPLSRHQSRRTRHVIHGKRVDLRRIMRKNMQFGGEIVLLDYKKKKLKNKKILFFCDVSGSMDLFTLLLLHFVHSLKRIDRRTEIFLFSTDLFHWTGLLLGSDPMDVITRLPDFVPDWGGGTRIGHCLEQFNERHAGWMLSKKSVVVIFSDGWDRGEPDLLAVQMARLQRRAYRVIWLNPLMGDKDYQPICQGMRTALPYVDHFLPMSGMKDIQRLGKTLSGYLGVRLKNSTAGPDRR